MMKPRHTYTPPTSTLSASTVPVKTRRVDLLKSGGVVNGFTYDLYLNWKLRRSYADKADAVDAARQLAKDKQAELHITI